MVGGGGIHLGITLSLSAAATRLSHVERTLLTGHRCNVSNGSIYTHHIDISPHYFLHLLLSQLLTPPTNLINTPLLTQQNPQKKPTELPST